MCKGKMASYICSVIICAHVACVQPRCYGSDGKLAATQPAATQPVAIDERRSDQCGSGAMASAFYSALWSFACGKEANAFWILNDAMDKEEPHETLYFYLPLYKRCFYDMAAVSKDSALFADRPYRKYTDPNAATVPRAADYVKAITLLSIGREPPDVRPLLRVIVEDPNEMQWKVWAQWMLTREDASIVSRECRRKGFRVSPAHLVANKILESGPVRGGIMRIWLRHAVQWQIMQELVHVEDIFKIMNGENIIDLRPGRLKLSREHWKQFQLPGELRGEHYLHRVCASEGRPGVVTKRELERIWGYFTWLRTNGKSVPDTVPSDREEFMRAAAGGGN